VPQDYAKARQYFDKAATLGSDRAQYNLGVMYYRGEGMKIDYPKALALFTQAANQAFPDAAFNLAVMYAKGNGAAINNVDAYAWFSIAASEGDPKAASVIASVSDKLSADEKKTADTRITALKKGIVPPKANS
jgi:TPR repeat protein